MKYRHTHATTLKKVITSVPITTVAITANSKRQKTARDGGGGD